MRLLIIVAATAFGIVVLPVLVGASLVFPLLPFVLAGFLLSTVIQRRRRSAVSRTPASARPYHPQPLPQHTGGGWAYIPVWVPPPATPAPLVVEGQVMERRDG
ncbi:hypothetical protein [Mycobacterium sp. 236(2023)]|uniref:hypothetical protein n=1 Tax=Mycobacterium sp. 236(2023) TaxID=3038163 RepID=UPI002414EF60|nr:hypothetical protein [Mycobacterium sp. 236(2023)]MDG4667946.1 hypothetical protein [Mycobacterium sp. 236(2023)]